MAIYYRMMQNKMPNDKNKGKYFAHTVKQSEISLEQVEQLIQDSCSAKISDVRMVVRELFEAVRHYMQNGHVVNLGDLGKFYISIKSIPVDNPSEFRPDRHVTGFKCNYTPSGHRYKAGSGRLTGHIHRSMLDGCKAAEISYYKGKAASKDETPSAI